MNYLVRELLSGPAGRTILGALSTAITGLDEDTQRKLRNGADYGDLRYAAGCADGMREAFKIIGELAKTPTE